MMNVPAGIRTISSWAGSLTRSAASFFPSGVHSLVTSATSNAKDNPPINPATAILLTIPALRTIHPPCVLHLLLFWLHAWLFIKFLQRLKVHRQIEQII